MSFVYAAPPLPPEVPVDAWRGMSLTWVGWDGSVWDLTRPAKGVFLESGGVEGLNMPGHTQWLGSSPAVHGQFYRGHSVNPREVFWPIHVYSDTGSADWVERDRAFWRTLQPGKYGSWTVSTSEGESRHLTVRFVDDGNHSFPVDPSRKGWASYGVTLVADDPFWYGQPRRRTWAQSESLNFFGGAALVGPPFNIASSSQLATATMTNPGDVEAWPVWTGAGPFTSLSVGVDGNVVEVPFEVLDGQTFVVDTDPTVQTAWLDGVDVTDQLGGADFAAIPAGEERPLSLAMVGTGSVMAEINPRYYKAW